MRSLRCGECGSLNVKTSNIKGMVFPYKKYRTISISKDYFLCKCQDCNNLIISSKEVNELNLIIEGEIKNKISALINNFILKSGMTQKNFSELLGLTEVYISNLVQGKDVPEFKTFNYIKLFIDVEMNKLSIKNTNVSNYIYGSEYFKKFESTQAYSKAYQINTDEANEEVTETAESMAA